MEGCTLRTGSMPHTTVQYHMRGILSQSYYNKTLMKSTVRKEKHSFWNRTLRHMPATQEAEAGLPEPSLGTTVKAGSREREKRGHGRG